MLSKKQLKTIKLLNKVLTSEWFVGGSIEDYFLTNKLNKAPKDIDIITYDPKTLHQLMKVYGLPIGYESRIVRDWVSHEETSLYKFKDMELFYITDTFLIPEVTYSEYRGVKIPHRTYKSKLELVDKWRKGITSKSIQAYPKLKKQIRRYFPNEKSLI